MPYDSDPDHYTDFETGVLKNLLDITTIEELEEAEADITAAAIAAVPEESPLGEFNLEHLQNIHWELFNAIYDWAGEIRDVDISKLNTRFANSDFIVSAAAELFRSLHIEDLLKNLEHHEYVLRLAYYYSEINILHPFREGNGRTQRVFFSQLVMLAGYRFAWERLDRDENLRVCIEAHDGSDTPLAEMLDTLLEPDDSSS
jgi:cell filamentation protein